ncbi:MULTISPECIES: hypothetical protein [Sphingomonas]|jgi:hypothetical protein|uniref:Uncharacterized protein n=1 Tax=Sphingomonas zeae TaxID=1646122 RepID=A0A7Y6B7B1_9SPHN|nr:MULTISPECIES: hypothetical protein [Sphingomonas]MBB4046604.1 hypothetical protein [Sphingomonas zeae]MDK8184382.1 hypothetical protein [Sphingomonas zeae]MDK8214529.1 hypothetical protein [Sphingomonas sp. UMB7805-LC452B]NUU48714.1 hypothetical protein [Sphingomonas zeae]
MGKKKHKKKQKKARLDEQPGTSQGSSPLHRFGQALLDQARSPAGRQLLATGLVVAASALARETGRRAAEEPTPAPDSAKTEAPESPKTEGTTRSGVSDVAAFAGMALSALDQFINRPAPSDDRSKT